MKLDPIALPSGSKIVLAVIQPDGETVHIFGKAKLITIEDERDDLYPVGFGEWEASRSLAKQVSIKIDLEPGEDGIVYHLVNT